MTTIHDIPLDAWATIMLYVDSQNLVQTFQLLEESNALNIDKRYSLDVFWILVNLARLQSRHDVVKDLPQPDIDSNRFMFSFTTLKEMGLDSETARYYVEHSHGNLQHALFLLGWT